jgi:multiple sugar transport system ATP-binding protein
MNLIDCELVYSEERAILKSGDFALDVMEFAETLRAKSKGRELVLGVRPEDVSVHVRKTDEEAMECEVQLVEPIGARSIYHLKIGGLAVLAKGYPMLEVDVGSKLWTTFNKHKLHVFDKKTEEAIV